MSLTPAVPGWRHWALTGAAELRGQLDGVMDSMNFFGDASKFVDAPTDDVMSLIPTRLIAEKLTADLVNLSWKAVTGDCRVFNMYGPTEATIISSVLEIKKSDNEKYKRLSSIPIGKPIANTNLLILDKHFNLCPIHVPGELYIGGDGLSGGYLNNPELTAEKFVLAHSSRLIADRIVKEETADFPMSYELSAINYELSTITYEL